MSAQLTGSSQAIQLGEGYALRAPGITGTASLKRPHSDTERARSRTADDGTADLDAALQATNVSEVRQIDLSLHAATFTTMAPLRSADGQQMIELLVPDLGPESGLLVLACDETGVLTWHLPVNGADQAKPQASRGASGAKRFLIPATQPQPPAGAKGQRSLLGVIGKKLLKVLVYPVLDPVIGAIGDFFVGRWEEKNRPYGLRDFSPANFRSPDAPMLAAADWQRITTGRALLFIHGTFSTAHGAFAQIPDATFAALHQRYDGRVFAFNHFSLSHDPRSNVEWLLQQLPPGPIEIDIVCHSRGGLVARTLAERPSVFGLDTTHVNVKRVVFVGVPNHGTLLAEPDHMVKMIDRLTTALNLFPAGPVSEALEAFITVIKVIGHGMLKGLDGLASMNPNGTFLHELNQGAPAGVDYYAIAADYEPTDQGLRILLTGAADAVLDRVFKDDPNDLVVPEMGVYATNGCGAFPLRSECLLRIAHDQGVLHTTIFGHRPASDKILEWLK